MARMNRIKIKGGEAWYHLYAKVTGCAGEYLLAGGLEQRQLLSTIRFYASVYCCDLAAFCVMGNHYHLVVRFAEFKTLDRAQLMERALRLYHNSSKLVDLWDDGQWQHFNERLFDVSELMRNIQMSYARWYNREHKRKGAFWADRFKSTLLTDEQSVLDCLLYVDLNPVRAGLVQRPEDYPGASVYFREMNHAKDLYPIRKLFAMHQEKAAFRDYKYRLYHRGAVPTKEGQATIPQSILKQEAKAGFAQRGIYQKRLRYFTDGVVIGSKPVVSQFIEALKEVGWYRKKSQPTEQWAGRCYSLLQQRSHFAQ